MCNRGFYVSGVKIEMVIDIKCNKGVLALCADRVVVDAGRLVNRQSLFPIFVELVAQGAYGNA